MILKEREIDYRLLSFAIDHYKRLNYQNVETPWIVDYENIIETAPSRELGYAVEVLTPVDTNHNKEFLVCSAEQGFIQLLRQGRLVPAYKFFSTSPCFRYEDDTEIHSKEFIKLELFAYSNTYEHACELMEEFVEDAYKFFVDHIDAGVRASRCGVSAYDLISSKDVELGSYGVREVDEVYIAYGTGLALPRASFAFMQAAKGYHVSHIPRAASGTVEKILEEVYELIDANKQYNKVMELCELSDILGAINLYLEQNHKSIKLHDLIVMADATHRAFKSGQRS